MLTAGGNHSRYGEIFTPPYLLRAPGGARPAINTAPGRVTYGEAFTITTPSSTLVDRVTLIALSSVTHSFNMNQRFLNLAFSPAGTGTWSVNASALANKRECPPGYYLLFVIDQLGVPSVGKIVQVLPSQAPGPEPDVLMVSPANGGFVQPGLIQLAATIGNLTSVTDVKFLKLVAGSWQQIGNPVAAPPYKLGWTETTPNPYTLKARPTYANAPNPPTEVDSPEITITINSFPTVSSTFTRRAMVESTYSKSVDTPNYIIKSHEFHYYPNTKNQQGPEFLQFEATGTDADTGGTVSRMELSRRNVLLRTENGTRLPQTGLENLAPRRGFNEYVVTARDNQNCETVTEIHATFVGGALDGTFNPSEGPNNTVYAILVQPGQEEKIVIGGEFTSVNGSARSHLARLKADGTSDSTFNQPYGADLTLRCMAMQSDGKIIVGGDFTQMGGSPRKGIARLNGDGSLETSFNNAGNVLSSGSVHCVAIQPDDKVLIGGSFIIGGVTRHIVRLKADDGTLDTSFNIPSVTGGTPVVYSMRTQVANNQLQKIFIGGEFTDVGGSVRNRIARLDPNGTLDTGFSGPTALNAPIRTMALQSDGKIIIGGEFFFDAWVDAAGTWKFNHLGRLTTAGAVDQSFKLVYYPGAKVHAVAIQSDGYFLVGGDFTGLAGKADYLARYNHDAVLVWQNSRPAPSNLLPGGYGLDGTVYAITVYDKVYTPDPDPNDEVNFDPDDTNERLLMVGGAFGGYKVRAKNTAGQEIDIVGVGHQKLVRIVGE